MKEEEKCEMKREKENYMKEQEAEMFSSFFFFSFQIFFAHLKIRNSGI